MAARWCNSTLASPRRQLSLRSCSEAFRKSRPKQAGRRWPRSHSMRALCPSGMPAAAGGGWWRVSLMFERDRLRKMYWGSPRCVGRYSRSARSENGCTACAFCHAPLSYIIHHQKLVNPRPRCAPSGHARDTSCRVGGRPRFANVSLAVSLGTCSPPKPNLCWQ